MVAITRLFGVGQSVRVRRRIHGTLTRLAPAHIVQVRTTADRSSLRMSTTKW
jgi:hypothetical protein